MPSLSINMMKARTAFMSDTLGGGGGGGVNARAFTLFRCILPKKNFYFQISGDRGKVYFRLNETLIIRFFF